MCAEIDASEITPGELEQASAKYDLFNMNRLYTLWLKVTWLSELLCAICTCKLVIYELILMEAGRVIPLSLSFAVEISHCNQLYILANQVSR